MDTQDAGARATRERQGVAILDDGLSERNRQRILDLYRDVPPYIADDLSPRQ